ncbi:AAA domain-containing protein [Actinocorallia sp. API 0066]|uniref:DEAD/DEAH box helicase n=1 Tax=Actinocorallia sp. API 0066 TaxID=2896846 RepID=UPI001E469848|nr:DEAD/DEAH box helicase [Actinocorallia sp. API 0066]MCD0449466.1 AAA domain-containing protein [Actinocorallia sp. API 0066]
MLGQDANSMRSDPGSAEPDHPLLREIARAIGRSDLAAYTTAFGIWETRVHNQRLAEGRRELIGRLAAVHPALAHELTSATAGGDWTSRLESLAEAWAWSAVAAAIRTHSTESATELQGNLDRLEDTLMRTTAELASEQAWWHCLRRMTVREASALRSFAREVQRVGRGKGRYAGRHRQGAREAMRLARDAVPAWVMPVRQVAETIEPRPDAFDVIIIDEASQLPVESAFLLWLAPQVIVVGDDKQCSPPMRVSGELEPIYERIEEYLPDVPRAFRHNLTPKSNLYELMNVRFPGGQRLTDHHRSMPEIIDWSSRMFYDGSLTPLRQYRTDRLPPLRVVEVPGGYREGREQSLRSPPEAERLVTELKAMTEDPAYSGKTFGIITLQGGERSGHIRLIEQLLDEHLPDQALRERLKIRVGTPPDFQGDQRDVVLLSMIAVDTPRIQGGADFERQRWNVAATRARDQLVLFTSTTLAQLKSEDLRASLLKHMLDAPTRETTPRHLANADLHTKRPEFDSLFE